jgi:hypothetical protein
MGNRFRLGPEPAAYVLNGDEGPSADWCRCRLVLVTASVFLCVSSLLFFARPAAAACPNEALRTGFSAALPDCRAYELVSPPESDGRLLGPIASLHHFDAFPTDLLAGGDSFLLTAVQNPLAIPGEANGSVDVYETVRSATGWSTVRRLSASGSQAVLPDAGGASAEHGYMFVNVAPIVGSSGGSLANGGTDYVSKPDGSFEETGIGSLGDEPLAQGRYISEAGRHVIFTTGNGTSQNLWCSGGCPVQQLEPDAPPTGTGAIYDREIGGPTRVVSLLPGNATPAAGEAAEYAGASTDGSAVAFKLGGTLYVRVDDTKTEQVTPAQAAFAGLSANGERLFFVKGEAGTGGDIEVLDTATETITQINSSSNARVVNVAADGSRLYFVSPSQLDGSKGTAGQPNLYVWTAGTQSTEYIATVAPSDLEQTSGTVPNRPALANWTGWVMNPLQGLDMGAGPGAESSRATGDGRFLVFESRAKLGTYENAGHTEIYRYDALTHTLLCASCNPSASSASSDAEFENSRSVSPPIAIQNLSEDGGRLFFETDEALVAADTDGTNDIYEWEEGTDGIPAIALISSGRSPSYPPLPTREERYLPQQNMLLAVSPSGDDVVFSASEQLVPAAGANGTQGIYDARVEGGIAEAVSPSPCSEEGCKPAPNAAPALRAPASQGPGAGNVRPRHCRATKRGKKAAGSARTRRACPRSHKGKNHKKGRREGARAKARAATAQAQALMRPSGQASATSGTSAATTSGPSSAVQGASTDAAAAPSGGAGGFTTAVGKFEEFGLDAAAATLSTAAAGAHPDFTLKFALNQKIEGGKATSAARLERATVSLPPGLVGDVASIPRCSAGSFAAFANCPVDSQVGVVKVQLNGNNAGEELTLPVYNLELAHPEREVARLGFFPVYPVYIGVHVRTATDYGVTATIEDTPGQQSVLSATTTLWGNPPDPSHDEQRLTSAEGAECETACKAPEGKRSAGIPPTSFITNPTACEEAEIGISVVSYQLPGAESGIHALLPEITECEGLPFGPSLEVEPTSHAAGAQTGLIAKVKIPQHEDPAERATSAMRDASVALPQGMGLASGAANGLVACSDEQVGYEQEVATACPDASKLGSATFVSPDLPEPLHGSIYQRSPEAEDLFRIWLVADEFGLHIKIPGDVHADPATGQLTTTFAELPQLPVEEVVLDFWGGPRAPLKNPEDCGTYQTAFAFTPWSGGPVASGGAPLKIDQGCGGHNLAPKLTAGVTNPTAGAFSPFVFELKREDGEPNIESFETTLPEGELAKLAGVPLCPSGPAARGACPAGSQIGSVSVASGPGPQPLWIPQPGKAPTAVYLGGPYKGAPYSIVTVVPAQAGPFDLGTVVVRAGLYVDPETARVTVKTDPLPQFLKGVPVIYRAVHVAIDRPDFSLNPTDCSSLAVTARVRAVGGASAEATDPFGVNGCHSLKFGPQLGLKLIGGTKRGGNPALTATLKARRGQANIGSVSVAMPHAEFLAQNHIRTVCTRTQFAARECPRSSIYGRAKAWTPLLEKPLEGPVYLRSSSHKLPDLVVALRGPLEIDLDGVIDSAHGGIRASFESIPDAPVTKFMLHMSGGARGLLENSQDECLLGHRATVRMAAQNGRLLSLRPRLRFNCPKG